MNKYMLTCFMVSILMTGIVPVMFAAEPATPNQSIASGNAVGDLTPYLKRSTSAEKNPDVRGFIQRWLLLEPIRQTSLRSNQQLTDSFVQRAAKTEYFPDQFTVVPHDGDKVTVGGEELTWHAIDSVVYDVNLFCFAKAMSKPTYNVLFWAVTIINCPQEIPGVRLAVGSNSASIWWVNDKEVIGIYGDRHMIVNDGISKRLTLKKGQNIVRCAVINAPGLSAFCARFIDGQDKPVLKGFTISAGDIKK
jgi:hypothetical protein